MPTLKTGLKIIAAVLLIAPFSASAQDNMMRQTPQERAQKQTRMLTKKLNLSADQANTLNSINMSFANSMDSMMHSGADRKSIGTARKQMAAQKEAQLQQLFTADQYKQYQAIEEERKQRMMQRRENMQGAGNQPEIGNNNN